MKLKEALKGKLSDAELGLLRASSDVVGDIAIIEIPFELEHKEKLIGETLLGLVKNIKVIAAKVGGHKGPYRAQDLKVIAGERRFETVHIENGLRFKVDVRTCYFSPRLGTERLRIARLVKPGERVLVAGSGVGPYPLVIAKHSKAKEVVGVELNPVAHEYALENAKLNKLQERVKFVCEDITKFRSAVFDRVIIAMPHDGVSIVPQVLKYVKNPGWLHFLDFAPESDLKAPVPELRRICAAQGRVCRVMRVVKAGQHAVRSYRVCLDVRIRWTLPKSLHCTFSS